LLCAIMRNLLGFVEQRKKMEAEAPTVQVGATPTELTATPPPQFYKLLVIPVNTCQAKILQFRPIDYPFVYAACESSDLQTQSMQIS